MIEVFKSHTVNLVLSFIGEVIDCLVSEIGDVIFWNMKTNRIDFDSRMDSGYTRIDKLTLHHQGIVKHD